MIKNKDIDKAILITVLALTVVGIGMIYSTSYIVALQRFQDGYLFLKKQLIFASIGIGGILIGMKIPYTIYRKIGAPLLLISLVLFGMVFIPGLGVKAGGSRRWLHLGFFNFQPSEFGKLAVVIYLAGLFSKKEKGEDIKDFIHGFLPPIIVGGIMITLLLLEPDFGTALSLGAIILLMMFVAGVKFRYLISLGLVSVPALYFMITTVGGYWLDRILSFLDPWKDPHGAGFQIIQSFIAFGSGGFWGVGLGDGRQKLFYLPEAHTDFILSVVGEELGLIGVSAIIVLYLVFILSGIIIAVRTSDRFGALLAFGITALIGLQAVFNMGVVTGLLPTKGLTLPFLSYGGTSLLMNMVEVGILLSISMTERN